MLIENWKSAYKYLTVKLAGVLFLLAQAYDYIPVLKEYVPTNYVSIFAVLIIFARLVAQPKVSATVAPVVDTTKASE